MIKNQQLLQDMEEQLQLFTVFETAPESNITTVNAHYDDEVRARRRFREIVQRKFNDISSAGATPDPLAVGTTTVEYRLVEDGSDGMRPEVLLSQKIFCDQTTVIPAGYFVGEQVTKTSKPILIMELTAGCNRVHLARHEAVKRDWLQSEEDLVHKIESLHSQLAWQEEKAARAEAYSSDYLQEIARLQREVEALDSSVAKLNLSNAKLMSEISQLRMENLQLYRSLQSTPASGPFSAGQINSPTLRTLERTVASSHPSLNQLFMNELRSRIKGRPQ